MKTLPAGFIVDGMSGVDLSPLTDSQRGKALELLNRMPCLASLGGVSVARCRRDSPTCVTSQRMADFIVDSVRRGMSGEDIILAVYNKALAEDYVPSQIEESLTNLPDEELPSLGPDNAPITVTVFYDYTGEISHKALESVEQLRALYPDRVRVVYWPAPRTRLRPEAELAARIAMAAHQSEKFDEIHKLLLENKGATGPEKIKEYADQTGLKGLADTANSGKIRNSLDRLRSAASRLDIDFPPVIFVQNRRIRGGAPSVCFLMEAVQDALVGLVRAEYRGLDERIAP